MMVRVRGDVGGGRIGGEMGEMGQMSMGNDRFLVIYRICALTW
jgi:hypothetical protein